MKELIGFVLLIAMVYGVVHFCGVAFGWLRQLAGIAVARRTGQRPIPANPFRVTAGSEQAEPDSSPSA
jgi:hypothetical protein